MRDANSGTPPSRFSKYLALGLAWGVLAAVALFALFAGVLAISDVRTDAAMALTLTVAVFGYTLIFAIAFAILVAPLAGIVAWQLYRAGIRSPAAYAAAGALSALPIPILFIAADSAGAMEVTFSRLLF